LIDSITAIHNTKDKQWDLNYVKARIYYEQNTIDSTLKYNAISTTFYQRLLEKNLFLTVGCFLKNKDFDKAEKMINSIEDTSPDIKLMKGHFYEVIQEKEKALKEYREIMEAYPSSYNFLNYNIEKVENGQMSKVFILPKDNIGREKWIVRPLFYQGIN